MTTKSTDGKGEHTPTRLCALRALITLRPGVVLLVALRLRARILLDVLVVRLVVHNQLLANKVKAEFQDLTTVYAKLNLPLGGTYLKVGYAQVDVISIENLDSGNSHGNDKSTGIVAGIGYDHELAGGVAIRAELTGMDMSDVTSNNGQTNKTEIKVQDMIGARGTISLVKSF